MKVEDYLTERGAKKLARKIRQYWADRGYSVTTDIEAVTLSRSGNGGPIYCVRTDMINGLPQFRLG